MSPTINEPAPNPEEVQLFAGAKWFHPYKLTSCPSCSEIKWTDRAYPLRDFTKATTLPTIVRVECGFLGHGNIDSVSSGQVAVIQGIYRQRRIVAVPCQTVYSHYFSFPMAGYPHKFFLANLDGNNPHSASSHCVATAIESIVRQVKLPVKIRFADEKLHTEYSYLQLVHIYEELYVYGHNMGGDGCMFVDAMFMPMYLDVTVSIAEGLVDGNQNDWIIFKDAYKNQSSKLLQGSLILGYAEMAIFDGPWNGLQSPEATEIPKSSDGCCKVSGGQAQNIYSSKAHVGSSLAAAVDNDGDKNDAEDDYHSYISPTKYINIENSLSHQSVSSTKTEYVQIEGLHGTIGRRMAAVLDSLERDPSQIRTIAPPPRPPKTVPGKSPSTLPRGRIDRGSEVSAEMNPKKEQQRFNSLPQPATSLKAGELAKARQGMKAIGASEKPSIPLIKLPPSRPLPALPIPLANREASTYDVPGDLYESMPLPDQQSISSVKETLPVCPPVLHSPSVTHQLYKPFASTHPLQKSPGEYGDATATAKTVNTMGELLQSGQSQCGNRPTMDPEKALECSINLPADVPKDFSLLSHKQLCACFRLMGLNSCAEAFEKEGLIDGCLLLEMDAAALCEHFSFTKYDAIKVIKFAKDGWRPR